MLRIHNKKHTPINWDDYCEFNRVQERYIKKIRGNKYIVCDGEFSDNIKEGKNIIKFKKYDNNVLFNLVQKWGYGYFHFVCEILPRILYYVKHQDKFINKKIFFLLYFNDNFILQYLKLLTNEIANIQIVPYDNNNVYNIEDIDTYLITPTICGNPSLEGISLIKHYYLNKIVPFDECCILIKRNEVDRRIENFDEVYSYLRDNYKEDKWVVFDKQSVEETMYLFNNAKVIIGSHGAGLSNIVFGNENTQVLEFVPKLNFNCCYWNLSNIMKQHHLIYPVENYEGNGSFKVDMNKFKKYITYIYNKINF